MTWVTWACLPGGVMLLYYGAEWLVRGSSVLALRLGLSPLLVGLTVVAYGTSMPEIFTSLSAGAHGHGGVALGNVIGSNLCNLGLMLGILVLLRPLPVQSQLLLWDLPFLVTVSVAFGLFLWDERLVRWEGGLLLTGLFYYTYKVIRFSRAPDVSSPPIEGVAPKAAETTRVPVCVAQMGVGLGLLYMGGESFLHGAVSLARSLDVSEALVGLTAVALGTSLPELAASLIALKRGHQDLAVGNIVGSSIFNLLGVAGLTSVLFPLETRGVEPSDMILLLFLTFVTYPLMRTDRLLRRWEGAALLAIYLGYLWHRFGA